MVQQKEKAKIQRIQFFLLHKRLNKSFFHAANYEFTEILYGYDKNILK